MTLEIITADALAGVAHGFFTRKGGASSGVFAGLNCGYGSSDQHEAVSINRQRVTEALNLPNECLATVHQVHSANVLTVSECPPDGERADAMVTDRSGIGLAVLTADCQPVLFSDRYAGVVGAAHAGWRGTLDGVLEATVDAMVAMGAERERISAVIGPTISQQNYEVGAEFLDRFLDEDPRNARFFAGDEQMYFDLPSYGLHRLREAGVMHAEWVRQCTYADEEHFYSYRRATHRKEADYGRLISVIRL